MRIDIDRKDVPGFAYLGYIDDDFTMFYAPDVVKAIQAYYPLAGRAAKKVLERMLEKAKKCVADWEIRDEHDEVQQAYVLNATL